MEAQPLLRRHCPLSRLCVVMINVAQRLSTHNGILPGKLSATSTQPAAFHARGSLPAESSTPSTFGELRDNASLIWIGSGKRFACSLLQHPRQRGFSPACFHPVKNSAMVHAPTIDTIPLVNVPVRLSPGSRARRRIRMPRYRRCASRCPAPPVGSTPPAPAKAVSRRQPSGPTASSPAAASPDVPAVLPTD